MPVPYSESIIGNFAQMKILDQIAEAKLDVDACMGVAAQDIVKEGNAFASKMAEQYEAACVTGSSLPKEAYVDRVPVAVLDARHRSLMLMELVHSLNYSYQSAREAGSDAANAIDLAIDILMKDWDKARKEMRYAEQDAKASPYDGCSGPQSEVCEKGRDSGLGRQGLQRR